MARQKKSEGLLWFRIYTTSQGAFESMEDEKIGKALKAAFQYFEAIQAAHGDTEQATQAKKRAESIEEDIKDPIVKIAFNLFKTGINDSIEAHTLNVSNGRAGQEAKQKNAQKQAQPDREQTAPQTVPAQKNEDAGPLKMTEAQKQEHQKKVADYIAKYGGQEPQPQLVTKWENGKGA